MLEHLYAVYATCHTCKNTAHMGNKHTHQMNKADTHTLGTTNTHPLHTSNPSVVGNSHNAVGVVSRCCHFTCTPCPVSEGEQRVKHTHTQTHHTQTHTQETQTRWPNCSLNHSIVSSPSPHSIRPHRPHDPYRTTLRTQKHRHKRTERHTARARRQAMVGSKVTAYQSTHGNVAATE